MRLSDILGCQVVGTTGWRFGKVYDVRADHDGRLQSLIVGRPGLAERLFGRGDPSSDPQQLGHGVEIPWDQVIDVTDKTITIEERKR
jgi:sporulation protein YlmC with PRC-barrel domain